MTDRSIFLAVLDIEDPEQRSAYLDQACVGNPVLRMEVEQLLKAHEQPGRFMERPASAPVATVDEAVAERPGMMIGPYKLMEEIGAGGFGLVFVAEQQQPVRRKVALKVIKPGMDSRAVLQRFEQERQALALMDHPNIAKVLDAGLTPTGQPFFVMELVNGSPLTNASINPARALGPLFVQTIDGSHTHNWIKQLGAYIPANLIGATLAAFAYDALATPRKVVRPIREAVTEPDRADSPAVPA